MSTPRSTDHCHRPAYCSDTLVESYKQIERATGNLRMLQTLKVIRAIVLNFLVLGGGVYFVYVGGDPTLIGGLTLVTLGLLNGIEVSEWIAAKQALDELNTEQQGTDNGED